MKPKANQGYRGDFNPIETSVPGMEVCEHLPMMAGVAEHFSVIRSTFHNSNTHGIGVHYNMTGLKNSPRSRGDPQMDRVDPPCVGGVIRQLRGDRNGLPACRFGAITLYVRERPSLSCRLAAIATRSSAAPSTNDSRVKSPLTMSRRSWCG